MPYRQLVFSLLTLIALFSAAFSQTETTENIVIKPGQKVFILAVKGECDPTQKFYITNGDIILLPPRVISATGEETNVPKTLQRFAPAEKVKELLKEKFQADKTFVVTDSLEKADFVFHVCATYVEDLTFPSYSRLGMLPASQLVYMQGRVMPAILYRRDAASIFEQQVMWKAITPDPARPPVKTNEQQNSRKKQDKKTVVHREEIGSGAGMVNRMGAVVAGKPTYDDLVRYFLNDFSKIEAISISAVANSTSPAQVEMQRPALTNKPADLNEVEKNIDRQANKTLQTSVGKEEIIKIETALVSVPVRVMDKYGKYVPRLARKDFEIFEDDSLQAIEHFSNEDDPFHVVLLLDMSGSTRFKVEEIQDAALTFIEQLRPQDRVLVVSFDINVRVDSEFTNDHTQLMKAILRTRTGGSTRLYDAIDLVLTERLNQIQGRKAIVLFSDGVDTVSHQSDFDSTLKRLEEANTIVYPIHYDTQVEIRPAQDDVRVHFEIAKKYVNELAQRSGGRVYDAATLKDAKTAFANIAEELRRQYWLSYYSTNPKDDGSYRKIRVAVTQPANAPTWAVRAKNGYRAPKK